MRRLLVAMIVGLVLVITASAAMAAEGDYPPEAVSSGVVQRAPAPAPAANSAAESELAGEDGLAGTGVDVAGEVGFGAGLLLLGGTALLLARRWRGSVRSRG